MEPILTVAKHKISYGITNNRQGIGQAGFRPGADVVLALDPASSGFYEDGLYHLRTEGRKVDAAERVAMYADWVKTYPIAVLEDGLAEDGM